MWTLEQIHATNFSAFKELDYAFNKGKATLVFGNNLDNDSQKSNGSGKSALIEAIAVILTGDALRPIKIEEIINDYADEGKVSGFFYNDFTNEYMTITRTLSRKSPQSIEVLISEGQNEDGTFNWVPQVQATVNDYNKYILEVIGLTKDDIYSNFILSKHKYHSFLDSSDKEKKEIINRFSNGILVDESIAALEADMLPIKANLSEAEGKVANCTGRVSAIDDQIQSATEMAVNRSKDKADRIQRWKESIAEKRQAIRDNREYKDVAEKLIASYSKMIEDLNDAEGKHNSVEEAYGEIMGIFTKNDITLDTDYHKKSEDLEQEVTSYSTQLAQAKKMVKDTEDATSDFKDAFNKARERYEAFKKQYDVDYPVIDGEIKSLLKAVNTTESEIKDCKDRQARTERQISVLSNKLAGVIVCPKCKHEFTLAGDIDIDAARMELENSKKDVKKYDEMIATLQEDMEKTISKGKEARAESRELETKLDEYWKAMSAAGKDYNSKAQALSDIKDRCTKIEASIKKVEEKIENVRVDMFDEAFKIVEDQLDVFEGNVESYERNISLAEGAIKSYESSIAEAENASEDDVIGMLKCNKEKYESELAEEIKKKNEIESELAKYTSQIAIFTDFKTHLANTKIEALGQITNEFLENIGSDIRIEFSGYTVLKSGKVRDKISISLLRNGTHCGSFGKFSEGEKARVNLANILAMHKLTNVNAPEGKGLDLLILDEILDATDETGLANIFGSLNGFKITSLVVSHGNIAENYPYKLVVTKQNGISFIDD